MSAELELRKQEMYESSVFDCPEFKQDVIKFAEQYANQREQAAIKEAINATLEGVLDWLKSDDCWVTDLGGIHIHGAIIDGRNIDNYIRKYISIEELKK